MFIMEVLVGAILVQECVILRGFSNIMYVNDKILETPQYKSVLFNTTANYNLNSKRIVKLIPLCRIYGRAVVLDHIGLCKCISLEVVGQCTCFTAT